MTKWGQRAGLKWEVRSFAACLHKALAFRWFSALAQNSCSCWPQRVHSWSWNWNRFKALIGSKLGPAAFPISTAVFCISYSAYTTLLDSINQHMHISKLTWSHYILWNIVLMHSADSKHLQSRADSIASQSYTFQAHWTHWSCYMSLATESNHKYGRSK